MTDPVKFWDGIAQKYAARPVDDPENYERTLDATRGYLTPEDEVLEVGCGTGSTALKLAPAVARYRATDISGKMIEIARAKPGAEAIDFAQAGIEDGNARYDAVLAFNLLHLVPDLDATLAEIAARLKPGGLLISKTICKFDSSVPLKWRLMVLALPLFQLLGKAPQVRFLTSAAYTERMRAAGFEMVETAAHGASMPHMFMVARKPV